MLEPQPPAVTEVQVGAGGRAACLPSLTVPQKQGCDAASSSDPVMEAAAFLARCGSPSVSTEDCRELPAAVQGHPLWTAGCLHHKELVVQLWLVFLHQWCSGVRKVRDPIMWSCTDSVQSLAGAPAATAMVYVGLHYFVLLAPPLWSCPSVLGLSGCLYALNLTLKKIIEANMFSRHIP